MADSWPNFCYFIKLVVQVENLFSEVNAQLYNLLGVFDFINLSCENSVRVYFVIQISVLGVWKLVVYRKVYILRAILFTISCIPIKTTDKIHGKTFSHKKRLLYNNLMNCRQVSPHSIPGIASDLWPCDILSTAPITFHFHNNVEQVCCSSAPQSCCHWWALTECSVDHL